MEGGRVSKTIGSGAWGWVRKKRDMRTVIGNKRVIESLSHRSVRLGIVWA